MLAIIASGNRTPKLRSVTTPTLVIHGSEDPLVRLEIGRDLAAAIRGARFVVVNGMGHNLPREAWPQILEALRTHAPPAS
jgi:pimeloyl-ACP methyl ester carboxylesterase